MRGRAEAQSNFVSLINTELLIAAGHPLRRIKRMVDEVLRAMSAEFEAMYSEHGRPSVPPERILKSKVLQALYSVRSDRQLMDRVTTDILFRWFLDMNLDEPVFDPTVGGLKSQVQHGFEILESLWPVLLPGSPSRVFCGAAR